MDSIDFTFTDLNGTDHWVVMEKEMMCSKIVNFRGHISRGYDDQTWDLKVDLIGIFWYPASHTIGDIGS